MVRRVMLLFIRVLDYCVTPIVLCVKWSFHWRYMISPYVYRLIVDWLPSRGLQYHRYFDVSDLQAALISDTTEHITNILKNPQIKSMLLATTGFAVADNDLKDYLAELETAWQKELHHFLYVMIMLSVIACRDVSALYRVLVVQLVKCDDVSVMESAIERGLPPKELEFFWDHVKSVRMSRLFIQKGNMQVTYKDFKRVPLDVFKNCYSSCNQLVFDHKVQSGAVKLAPESIEWLKTLHVAQCNEPTSLLGQQKRLLVQRGIPDVIADEIMKWVALEPEMAYSSREHHEDQLSVDLIKTMLLSFTQQALD